MTEKENAALAKLQAAAGLVVDKPQVERLDWMYEQSAVQTKSDEDALMNMPVTAEKDKDIEDMKKLGESTAGSLFLKSATKTTEDMLRKLREDPLFQIKRQEQAARESAMANPLIRARIEKKAAKEAKKQAKKEKKAAKKAKKAAKKAKKAAKKAAKKGSSSSSDSSDSSSAGAAEAAAAAAAVAGRGPAAGSKRRADSPARTSPARASRRQSPPREAAGAELGPSGHIISKREEYAATIAARKDAALASRGAARRMTDEEKRRRLEQMSKDAASHERYKDHRIASAEQREREQEEKEAKMRMSSDQKYFREIRQDAYMDSGGTMADRLKNQRHRRQKHLNDPLERDG